MFKLFSPQAKISRLAKRNGWKPVKQKVTFDRIKFEKIIDGNKVMFELFPQTGTFIVWCSVFKTFDGESFGLKLTKDCRRIFNARLSGTDFNENVNLLKSIIMADKIGATVKQNKFLIHFKPNK